MADSQDPYLNLGFGIIAYFRMLQAFIMLFIFFSILSLPALYIYSSHNGLSSLKNYSKTQFSLGNLGFSDNVCFSMYLGVGSP